MKFNCGIIYTKRCAWKSLIKKMKRAGFEYLLIPIENFFNMQNIDFGFLRRNYHLRKVNQSELINDCFQSLSYLEANSIQKIYMENQAIINDLFDFKNINNELFFVFYVLLNDLIKLKKYANFKNINIILRFKKEIFSKKYLQRVCDYYVYENNNIYFNNRKEYESIFVINYLRDIHNLHFIESFNFMASEDFISLEEKQFDYLFSKVV